MPIYSTVQTHMTTYFGRSPEVNDNHIIDNISFRLNMSAKTADYQVLASESGTVFTNGSATGGVNFTLPAVEDGLIYWFINTIDGAMVITAAANTMAGHNDATATTCTWTESASQIGCGNMVFSDGTYWYNSVFPGLVDSTVTFA